MLSRLLRRESDPTVGFVLRVLQLTFAAVALVLFGGSFKGHEVQLRPGDDKDGQVVTITAFLGGPTLNFALLVTFAASLHAALWVLFVDVHRRVHVPRDVALIVDAIFTVFLLSGASAMAASDYLQYCHVMPETIHCGVLQAAVVFTFFAFLASILSVAWGSWVRLGEPREVKRPPLPVEGHAIVDDVDYLNRLETPTDSMTRITVTSPPGSQPSSSRVERNHV